MYTLFTKRTIFIYKTIAFTDNNYFWKQTYLFTLGNNQKKCFCGTSTFHRDIYYWISISDNVRFISLNLSNCNHQNTFKIWHYGISFLQQYSNFSWSIIRWCYFQGPKVFQIYWYVKVCWNNVLKLKYFSGGPMCSEFSLLMSTFQPTGLRYNRSFDNTRY